MKSRNLFCQVSEAQLVARTSLTVPIQGHGCQRCQRLYKGCQRISTKSNYWNTESFSCYHRLCKFISSAKLRRGGHHAHKEQRVASPCHLLKAFKALLIGFAHLVPWSMQGTCWSLEIPHVCLRIHSYSLLIFYFMFFSWKLLNEEMRMIQWWASKEFYT